MTNTNFPQQYSYTKNCHRGNTLVYKHPKGGALFIGGWNQGATFDYNTHVIDLTGAERKWHDVPVAYDTVSAEFMPFMGVNYAGWIDMPFPDFKTPSNLTTRKQWEGIAGVIKKILKSGKDVLVACHGGHGRSGLFCAIVGYILGVDTDRSWASPVEKIRKIHCNDAVETWAQEKYVYDMLGLEIQIKRVYAVDTGNWKYEKCPICGTQSTFVQDLGMCLGCEKKYKELAPEKDYFTAGDLKTKGEVDHACSHENCIGIWKAKECGHTVHDMIIVDGYCETCYEHIREEQSFAESKMQGIKEDLQPCAICEKETWYADKFGVCYECAQQVATGGQVDYVHNSITDGYRALPHHCDDVGCVGIVIADVCGHVVHNQEIENGRCPTCLSVDKEMGE